MAPQRGERGGFMDPSSDFLEEFLEHHGVKGMKWGVRKDRPASVKRNVKYSRTTPKTKVKVRPGRTVKASGGKKHTASEDAIVAAVKKQMAKKSTTDSLSTKDLQSLVQRMNLEQQYRDLAKKQRNQTRVARAKAYLRSPEGKALLAAAKAAAA